MSKLNIGENINVVNGQLPARVSVGDGTPITIDTQGFRSLCIVINWGAATGSPSAVTLNGAFKHSTTDGTFIANTDYDMTEETDTAGGIQKVNVPLDEGGINRYVQYTLTTAFTTGTSPTIPCSVVGVLGNKREAPIT